MDDWDSHENQLQDIHLQTTLDTIINNKSSKKIYKAVAKEWGITCKMSEQCRCIDCQGNYFDCEYDEVRLDGDISVRMIKVFTFKVWNLIGWYFRTIIKKQMEAWAQVHRYFWTKWCINRHAQLSKCLLATKKQQTNFFTHKQTNTPSTTIN